MTTTWGEIKDSLYRLMYLSSAEEDDYDRYLLSAANYAQNEIAVNAAPLYGEYRLVQSLPENLLPPEKRRLHSVSSESTLELYANGVKSLAFSYMGECSLNVTQNGVSVSSVTLSSPNFCTNYRSTLSERGEVRLIFTPSTHLIISEPAMYATSFSGDVPLGSDFIVYDIASLLAAETDGDIFYCFDTVPLLREGSVFEAPLYYVKNQCLLAISAGEHGVFRVSYRRLPKKLTAGSSDSTAIDLPDYAAPLMPILMAWRIFKDDDERKAAMYYNEYQQAKAELASAVRPRRNSAFVGEGGIV